MLRFTPSLNFYAIQHRSMPFDPTILYVPFSAEILEQILRSTYPYIQQLRIEFEGDTMTIHGEVSILSQPIIFKMVLRPKEIRQSTLVFDVLSFHPKELHRFIVPLLNQSSYIKATKTELQLDIFKLFTHTSFPVSGVVGSYIENDTLWILLQKEY